LPKSVQILVFTDFDFYSHRRERPTRLDSSLEPEDEQGENQDDDNDEAFSRMLQDELEGNEGIGFGEAPTQKPTKPQKQRKKPLPKPKDARAVRLRAQEKEREKEASKIARSQVPNPRGGKAAGKGKGKGKAGKKKGGKSAKGGRDNRESYHDRHVNFGRGRQDGEDDIGQMILDDLMHDPISDRLLNPIFEVDAEPTIVGGNKETQLQKLYANIPEGSSTAQARSDRQNLKAASKSFGYAKVKARDGKWLVKGMKSTLYHHQLLGAQWMVSRELSDSAPYGGLLADSMGLGKTVQTLACMVGNPPSEQDLKRNTRCTLIVVPASVIDQWIDEIHNHAEEAIFPKVMRYKASSKIPAAVLQDLDIVVTSYHEVMAQFPFPDKHAREDIAHMGHAKWWRKAKKNLGDLHKVDWYRVVLDEAHVIKNNASRTSLACQNLKSVFRWCLTGTPLLNSLEE
jgi:hypothetical protein